MRPRRGAAEVFKGRDKAKDVTHENFILKRCTRDYVLEIARRANFGFNRYRAGASCQRGKI